VTSLSFQFFSLWVELKVPLPNYAQPSNRTANVSLIRWSSCQQPLLLLNSSTSCKWTSMYWLNPQFFRRAKTSEQSRCKVTFDPKNNNILLLQWVQYVQCEHPCADGIHNFLEEQKLVNRVGAMLHLTRLQGKPTSRLLIVEHLGCQCREE